MVKEPAFEAKGSLRSSILVLQDQLVGADGAMEARSQVRGRGKVAMKIGKHEMRNPSH